MQRIGQRTRHILTFDLEEHFHAARFNAPIRRRHWSSFRSQVQSNVKRILELLAHHSAKAKYFALGWLSEQHPSVIRAVSEAGWLHRLRADFQFGPVCEVLLPIREEVRSASAQAVPSPVSTTHGHLTKEDVMQCTRCAGLRVPEIIYEGGSRVLALRCVHCGDIIDRVIALNRQRRRLPYPNRTRTPIYESDRRKKNLPTMA